jgi:hypothetical protein
MFVAIERISRLALNVDDGASATTNAFVEGFRHAVTPGRFQTTTEGFSPYKTAIPDIFWGSEDLKANANFCRIHKRELAGDACDASGNLGVVWTISDLPALYLLHLRSVAEFTDSEILIYQGPDGSTRIDVTLADDTVWLSQAQMAELFQTSKQNISLHVKNIFEEKELRENSVVKEYLTTAQDGKRYQTKFYNLDVIISVGYRVRSHRGTQFRIWATQRLREYIVKGFALDDQRLKEGGRRDDYFDELIERVREIRTSERNFYRKITDIYSTSYDYDANAAIARQFLATVQNKFHWAIHGHTAAELIAFQRQIARHGWPRSSTSETLRATDGRPRAYGLWR